MEQPLDIALVFAGIGFGLIAIAFPVRMLVCCFSPRARERVRGRTTLYALWGVFSAIYLGGALLQALDTGTDRSEMARVHAALLDVEAARIGVETYWVETGRFPASNREAAVRAPLAFARGVVESVTIGPGGTITVRFAGDEPEPDTAQARTLVYTPVVDASGLRWDCSGGDLPSELRPEACGI